MLIWDFLLSPLQDAQGMRLTAVRNSNPATVDDVILGFRTDESFRVGWNSTLAEIQFTAFRWETPPVTIASRNDNFECVILNDPHLDRTPDPTSFSEYFAGTATGIAVFPNLRKDAMMIVPCPIADHAAYGHLAAFVRHAPSSQRDALWKTVGEVWGKRVSQTPVWLSTAGAGVPWLHVRLDSVPKYYWHVPYRRT